MLKYIPKDISIQLTREICHITNSNELFEIIKKVTTDILENGVGISISNYLPTSSIEFSGSNDSNAKIRLNIKKNTETILVIWDILHEYGHFLSGKPEIKDISREVEAWNRAYMILLNYQELVQSEQSFFKYQTLCLETYYKNNKL